MNGAVVGHFSVQSFPTTFAMLYNLGFLLYWKKSFDIGVSFISVRLKISAIGNFLNTLTTMFLSTVSFSSHRSFLFSDSEENNRLSKTF